MIIVTCHNLGHPNLCRSNCVSVSTWKITSNLCLRSKLSQNLLTSFLPDTEFFTVLYFDSQHTLSHCSISLSRHLTLHIGVIENFITPCMSVTSNKIVNQSPESGRKTFTASCDGFDLSSSFGIESKLRTEVPGCSVLLSQCDSVWRDRKSLQYKITEI